MYGLNVIDTRKSISILIACTVEVQRRFAFLTSGPDICDSESSMDSF